MSHVGIRKGIRAIQNARIADMIEQIDAMLASDDASGYILKDVGLRDLEKFKEFLRSFE